MTNGDAYQPWYRRALWDHGADYSAHAPPGKGFYGQIRPPRRIAAPATCQCPISWPRAATVRSGTSFKAVNSTTATVSTIAAPMKKARKALPT